MVIVELSNFIKAPQMNNSELPEFLSCQQVRSVDRFAIEQIGMEGLVLMENAARGCVDLLENTGVIGAIAVVCGKGNNGGDGLAMVRHLLVRGFQAKAVLLADPERLQGDALANYQVLHRISSASIDAVDPSQGAGQGLLGHVGSESVEWIVDAVLGTGTQGTIGEPFASWIDQINESPAKVLAVDIPSGMNGDTGELLGHTVRAEKTATFVRKKNGFQNPVAQEFLGEIHVLDIGIPDSVIRKAIGQIV